MKKIIALILTIVFLLSLAVGAIANGVKELPDNFPEKHVEEGTFDDLLSLKVDPPETGTYYGKDNFFVYVNFSSDGKQVNWEAHNGTVYYVFVKGGRGGNLYSYMANGATGAENLIAPEANKRTTHAISHLVFYYKPILTEVGKSSLKFVNGQSGFDNGVVWAVVQNGGGGMTGTVEWELYYAAKGNPKFGDKLASGTINQLNANATQTLSIETTTPGNYMFKAYQEDWHPGTGVLWSNEIIIPIE